MATDDCKIGIKIIVNKLTNRVIFVDSGGDFVDVLLSFVTLSLGAIVRLTGKQLPIGSLNQIYESIENLDSRYFISDACKSLFLRLKNPATKPCEGLKIDIEDGKPKDCYFCRPIEAHPDTYCSWDNSRRRVICENTKLSSFFQRVGVPNYGNVGVFVKEGFRFMITDDCIITQASTEAATALLKKLSITDVSCLEEREVHATASQILRLLSRCFVSATPLTDVFLVPEKDEDKGSDQMAMPKPKPIAQESLSGISDQKMKVRILFDELNERVLLAEANQDFVDLLFTILSFPIGSVLNRIGRQFSFGCINNLYMSIETLSLANPFISNEIKDGLFSPEFSPLPPFAGLKNQLILQKAPSERLSSFFGQPQLLTRCSPMYSLASY